MIQFPESYFSFISISLMHSTRRVSISSLNYPVLMYSVSSISLRTFQLSRRISLMLALSCKRIVNLLDFPSRLSSRKINFLNFKNFAKTKIELPTIKLRVKFPTWILKELTIYDRLTPLLQTVVVCGLILRGSSIFFVVGGRKINPILPRCKSFFSLY
jgi:hypothetical protein